MSHCHRRWGPGWWRLVPAVLAVALSWCRGPGRGHQEVLGPLCALGGAGLVLRLRVLPPPALTGFFLGL